LDHPALKAEPRLALLMGTEGDGLAHHTISEADYTVRIPMSHDVDSLNVAAASAVAFWELRKTKEVTQNLQGSVPLSSRK
jgi:tRNA G18 (ribose-2'-O)-methylase SpoU